jgi:hypothetical protein
MTMREPDSDTFDTVLAVYSMIIAVICVFGLWAVFG